MRITPNHALCSTKFVRRYRFPVSFILLKVSMTLRPIDRALCIVSL